MPVSIEKIFEVVAKHVNPQRGYNYFCFRKNYPNHNEITIVYLSGSSSLCGHYSFNQDEDGRQYYAYRPSTEDKYSECIKIYFDSIDQLKKLFPEPIGPLNLPYKLSQGYQYDWSKINEIAPKLDTNVFKL